VLKDAPSIQMIEVVAAALGDLLPEVVFIGGATTPFYIKDEATPEVRPTEDVDCIIEIADRSDYYELESKLRSKGFSHSDAKNAPICRWKVGGISVDVMPTDKSILGFSSRWYKVGIRSAIQVNLPSGKMISIFSLPYFIAAKIEAYHDRGTGDFRLSHDIEDIVMVLDGQVDFTVLDHAPPTVLKYLKETFAVFLRDNRFLESLSGHLEPGPTNVARTKHLLTFLNKFAAQPLSL